ncbi:GspE/PulE family protein, partial [Candidatus Synechococcus spongiarum]
MTSQSFPPLTPTGPGPLPEAGWQLVRQGFCSEQQVRMAFQRCRSGGDNLTQGLEDLAGHALSSQAVHGLQELQHLEQQLLHGRRLANGHQAVKPAGELSELGDASEQSNQAEAADLAAVVAAEDTSPAVAMADKILMQALSQGASDIHVEPQENELVVRLRQDGVLQTTYSGLPKQMIPAVTSRFKIMADLDIAERRLPQDGRIRRRFQGRTVDFRVSSLPSRHGEKICLRLLDHNTVQLGLDQLITNEAVRTAVQAMGTRPHGMVLVTGPTGSGKSTTLYALLALLNQPGINISTVEDPVEYTLPGITQTQVNREKGLDFAKVLRAFMRQDPDVLLVGETRDRETAKIAVEAALTGHLVLTTLHCNDAPSAIVRLQEMGIEPFLVAASLLGVVSQRLLRR